MRRRILGRRVEVISRDDAGKPEDAIRLATELKTNEGVVLVTGTFLSNVGLRSPTLRCVTELSSSPRSR